MKMKMSRCWLQRFKSVAKTSSSVHVRAMTSGGGEVARFVPCHVDGARRLEYPGRDVGTEAGAGHHLNRTVRPFS